MKGGALGVMRERGAAVVTVRPGARLPERRSRLVTELPGNARQPGRGGGASANVTCQSGCDRTVAHQTEPVNVCRREPRSERVTSASWVAVDALIGPPFIQSSHLSSPPQS
ncbi:hypothetical protein AAFF_G00230410 [Aldrovandia affinis]|uniref:Uncharacterized protein n=1 Tax=Aldrovandia affinis TaxID=143900 RepID=A0AAD7W3S2_9TELE|nr:hypothetical protein AAFF_G00230410 [Aldrovandia affinis]